MAYVESHQSLLRHPKTSALISLLHGERYKVIGHLHALWWWALDIADEDGNLPAGTTALALADGAGWPEEDAAKFVSALRRVGFMEKKGWQLHDWKDYTWRYYAGKSAAALNGAFGNHKRWHVDRQLVDPNCGFCRGDSLPDVASDIGGDIASESLSNSLSHPPNNQPIDLNSRIATKPARESPWNLSDDEWRQVIDKFPGVYVQGFWREWVEWIERSKGKKTPDDKVGALIGFIAHKLEQQKASSVAAARS